MRSNIYTLIGLESFIFRGWQALKKDEGIKAYISFCPYFMGKHSYLIEKFMLKLGFRIEEILKGFNVYPPYFKPDYYWKLIESDYKLKTLSLRKKVFLNSDLYVLRLIYPDMGNNTKRHKGDLYDYIYLP